MFYAQVYIFFQFWVDMFVASNSRLLSAGRVSDLAVGWVVLNVWSSKYGIELLLREHENIDLEIVRR